MWSLNPLDTPETGRDGRRTAGRQRNSSVCHFILPLVAGSMHIGALVVGIENYVDSVYRQSQFRLRYAVEDAEAFERYWSTAWQDESLFMRCLPNEQATTEEISAAAAWLAQQHIDILFVYFSGHGDKGSDGDGWFCLVDAVPGKRSLDGTSIDSIFSAVGASTSLLLLDCCYAEAVLSRSRFFSSLHNARARLFLCSSRSNQRTWEDDGVRHGIFSNILLRSLSIGSSIASPSGLIDIDAALFPYLCEQVPLAVGAAKGGQRQEPVKGGVSSAPVAIPTVSARLLGRQLSTYDAVMMGTRRWLGRAAAAAVLTLVVIQLSFYHLAIGPTGEIEVRSDLKATEPVTVLSTPVQTGLTQSDLVTEDGDPAGKLRSQLVRLVRGEIWGISLHRQENGLKTWFDQLIPMLNPGAQAQATVLATGRLPAGFTSADPDKEGPPFRAILDAALLSDGEHPDTGTRFRFDYDLPTAADLDCAKAVANIRDFSLSEPNSSVIAEDLSWNTPRAVLQPADAIAKAVDASKVLAYRIAQADQHPEHYSPGKEARALAAALQAVTKIRALEGYIPPDSVVPLTPPRSWCEPGLATASLFLGGQEASGNAATALAASVVAEADTVNDPIAGSKSVAALAALQVFARSKELPAAAIDAVVQIMERNDQGPGGEPDTSQWLHSIALYQSFPPRDIEWLLSQLIKDSDNPDFSALTAFNILSRAARHLEEDKRRILAAWYEKHFGEYRTQSDFADAAGYLGAVVPPSPDPTRFLSDRLVPEIYVSARTKTRRGTLIIRSTDFEAGIGLGVLGQATLLPGSVVAKLYRFAAARANLGDLRDVYEALAHQRSVKAEEIPEAVLARVRATRSSRETRQVEIEIATALVVHQQPETRERIFTALRKNWRDECEPDVKMALAQVLVGSKLRIDDIALPREVEEADDTE